MSGMEPVLIGAALGGGSAAAMGKNPIQGALLGGLTGGVYGAASNAANVANATAAGESVIPYAAAGQTSAPAVLQAPTIGQTLKQVPSALKQGIYQNPGLAMQGFNAAQGLLTPEQAPMAPAGQVHRGGQMASVDFASALNPYQNSVIRQQPISLI